ncbi:MAG: amidoligase family protein [Polyangiales bacterium]
MTSPTSSLPYEAPPRRTNQRGDERHVGLELELGHLTIERTLEVVRDAVGGEIVSDSRTEGCVKETPFGKFKIELDSTPLKERSYLRPLELLGVDADSPAGQVVEDSVLNVAREIVPIEVVTPPIPLSRLHELDPLWAALRAAGAEDTHSRLLNAFGLHLNPEPPDLEVGTILDTLRAFLLLEDWIVQASDVDISRMIAPYIRKFPETYRRKVLEPAYRPTWVEFVDDYLRETPTRNRPLDLLPLIAHIGAPNLAERVEEWELVSPRPTYHYRLPNCELSRPGWTPAVEWNRWVLIERIADDRALLTELSMAYLATTDWPLRMQRGGWVDQLRARLSLDAGAVHEASSA